MTKPLTVETPLVDQFMKVVDTARVKGLEIDCVEVNEPTWIRFCNEADFRWGSGEYRDVGEYTLSLYGVKIYRRGHAYSANNQFIVRYKPLEEPSWTVQVVNDLTGDITKAMKLGKDSVGDSTDVYLNVKLPNAAWCWDNLVTLP